MPGNSQRKGAVRKKGKTTPAGSGGRVRRGLEGKGPTPKAEDRPYHKAYRRRGPDDPGKSPNRAKGGGRTHDNTRQKPCKRTAQENFPRMRGPFSRPFRWRGGRSPGIAPS